MALQLVLFYLTSLTCIPLGSQQNTQNKTSIKPFNESVSSSTFAPASRLQQSTNPPKTPKVATGDQVGQHNQSKRSQQPNHNNTHNATHNDPIKPIATTKGNSTAMKVVLPIESTRQLDFDDRSKIEERSNTTALDTRKRLKAQKTDFSHLFREEVDYYPEEEIRIALKQIPTKIKELFNAYNTPLDPNVNLTERIAHQYGDEDESGHSIREESICRTVLRDIYPREANRGNSLVYVPNDQEFMQIIRAEICQHPNDECSYLRDNLPYGMISACHQKYSHKKLLYFDPLEKKMDSDLFRYPSCCSCYVSTSIDLRSSSMASSTTRKPSKITGLDTDRAPESALALSSEKEVVPSTYQASEYETLPLSDTNISFAVSKLSNNNPVKDKQQKVPTPTTVANDSILAGSKREAKALSFQQVNNNSESASSAPSAQQKRPSDGDRVKLVESPNPKGLKRSQSSTTNRTVTTASSLPIKAEQLEVKVGDYASSQTLILQEDKVYAPQNEF